MKAYDLYGVACSDLEEARAKVEPVLGVRLAVHESDCRCGEYYAHKRVGEQHFILQRNYDSFENEWTEPDSQDKSFLLYVNETDRCDGLRGALERVDGVALLKQEEI